MKKITVRNIPFDNVTIEEALLLAEKHLQTEGMSVVVTPNAEIAQMALEDEGIHRLITSADLILPDGAGILMAAEILGTPLKEKVAGVDFGLALLAKAAEKGYRVFLLGGKPGVAEKAQKKLAERFPTLSVVGTHDGYFDKESKQNDNLIKAINVSKADILYICLGAPAQEKWAMENREKLTSVRLAACLGGSLDIYAGTAKRAPKLFIKFRMEWFYRLLREPRRLGRMMRLPKYIKGAKKEAKMQKKKG